MRFAGCTKFDVATFAPLGLCFVVQLGVDEFENFLEGIHAGIRQHQVFKVEDDLFERPLFGDEFVTRGEFFNRDTLVDDLGERLVCAGDARKVFVKVRISAAQMTSSPPFVQTAIGAPSALQ